MATKSLQFLPLSSFVQSSFWNKVADFKINVDKLEETERPIWGFYSNICSNWNAHVLEVDSTSFNKTFPLQAGRVPFHGFILNKNTIEQFRDCDKTDLINKEGRKFLEQLKNGTILENPSLLNFFFVLSFSDLKKYHFYYWFAFPVLHSLPLSLEKTESLTVALSNDQIEAFSENYNKLDAFQKPYFILHNAQIHAIKSKLEEITVENYHEYYLCISDSQINQGNHPKSQFKNFVLLLLHYNPFLGGKVLKFVHVSLDKKYSCSQSLVYYVKLPEIGTDIEEYIYQSGDNVWAGWEKNENSKFAPRFSNMKATMDPLVLYEESMDLNLKLMKWRLLPDIDLEQIKNLNCVLLGAGTLGCSVSRILLAWGVRNISLVDNSTVSFSNPVRQSLYTYEDAIAGKPKAQAAAESLKKIFPGINCKAHNFTIPMPGHTLGENTVESARQSVAELETLIKNCDAVFLLTDSRESRWLPTLLGIHHKKIIINVALGFDSYLIMRYGGDMDKTAADDSDRCKTEGYKKIPGNRLGCYFCNDITAPGNSLKDRTLDQQCTVTRPGVSAIAGALAVELFISITQHPEGPQAAAFYSTKTQNAFEDFEDDQSMLGLLPHSIRGFLSSFTHVLPATPKYDKCIACSPKVLDEFEALGFDGFLLKCFNSSKYLEDLTGLTELFNQDVFAEMLALDDEDSDEGSQ